MHPDKYQETYRISSARFAGWDYGSDAAYFVTICTRYREPSFGEVIDGQVNLSPLGEQAWACWRAIPEHYPFVMLDGFVAMPNHVHGVIVINKASVIPSSNQFGPQSQNLAAVVRGFKIGVTNYARLHQIKFDWQARFHDHIIRNSEEHERIRKYIQENPRTWATDRFYRP